MRALLGAGPLQLRVAPEGTRSNTRTWKTGFYYSATGAGVLIVMAYMDYAEKRSGLGAVFVPSGDIERDSMPCMNTLGRTSVCAMPVLVMAASTWACSAPVAPQS